MSPPTVAQPRPEVVTRVVPSARAAWVDAATSADHKAVAKLWIGTSLTFLAVTVVLFALTRIQLIVPDSTIIVPEVFNRILSATSITAVVFFAVPLVLGLVGYVVPLQIGARRHAIPGARMFLTVARRLIAKQTKPRVARPTPPIQASTPFDGENTSSERGGSGDSAVSGTV